jgi:acetylornithine aminotransferase
MNKKNFGKTCLWNQHIFTGEAKPNTIRLLPSLALKQKDIDDFLESVREELGVAENA